MRHALTVLLPLLLAARADAGQVLKFSEEGTRDGKSYRSSLTLRVSAEGVRAEATDLSEPGTPKTVVYLYVAQDGRILPVDPPTGPVISAATIAAVEERARAAGQRRRPGAFSATPLHSDAVVRNVDVRVVGRPPPRARRRRSSASPTRRRSASTRRRARISGR